MKWKLGKCPYLRSASGDADDLLVVANSFEPRCLFAVSTARAAGYKSRKSLIVNFESNNQVHAQIKSKHRRLIRESLQGVSENNCVAELETKKYDAIALSEDTYRYLIELGRIDNILIDISTFTKCALAAFLSVVFRTNPCARVRCVWTPGVYGESLEITRGVKDTFVVPGFGGVGWRECRVLVLFLGQELSRAYALWRTVDPDVVYMIASESEYSTVSAQEVFKSARLITALVEARQHSINGVDPGQSEAVLKAIREELRAKGYVDEIAVACFGTKAQLLGVWSFFHEQVAVESSWHYVYAIPKMFTGNKYTKDFVKELNEIDLIV